MHKAIFVEKLVLDFDLRWSRLVDLKMKLDYLCVENKYKYNLINSTHFELIY